MSNRKGKLKPSRFDEAPESQLIMRFVSMDASTVDKAARSVQVVVATENPVERYDLSRGIVVREVLTMDGIEFRGNRNQLPIVDSHDRSTVRNVLGSVRNLRVEGDALVGDASFASDEESQTAFNKLLDGHLTDFSITATPKEIGFVERGKTYTNRRGELVPGPADIVTRWMPTDASLCATGADERSTVRRSYLEIPTEIKRNMDESLIQALVGMGMPEGLSDANAILAWVVGNLNAGAPEQAEPIENAEEAPPAVEEEESPPEEIANEAEEEMPKEEIEAAIGRALKDDQKRRKEIIASCAKVGIERAFADSLCDEGVSLNVARERIIERMQSKPLGQSSEAPVRVTESSDDKFNAAVRDGLLQRAYTSAGVRRSVEAPAPGAEDFAFAGLSRIAENFVRRAGGNVDKMAPKDIALAAMGHPGTLNRFPQIRRDAYHTQGSFANLLLDASNKTLVAGYEEAPFTWSQWARQAPSTADFKAINRIRFSESPDLEMVPENHDYKEGAVSDAKESYKVEKFGKLFSVTWEMVVGDDLDAIGRIPAMQGAAARRVQNKKVYEVLTANDNLSDGGALFNTTAQSAGGSGHANLASSGAAPSVSTLNTAFVSMMTKKGLDGVTVLNIQPSFLIVPVALSATALQLVGSIADPSVGGSSAGNSNTKNIYGPNADRPLKVVVEAQLDSNSATAWYLAASNGQVDTVELCFLQGEESPVLENEWDFNRDCYKFKIRQTFGVKALDFRGLYKNPGV